MFKLIEYDCGIETEIANFKSNPSADEVRPLLDKYNKQDRADHLVEHNTLALGVGRYLIIKPIDKQRG